MSTCAAVLPTSIAVDQAAQPFATLVGKPPPRRKVSTGESALLATVAHELRNPLASLRLSLDMLVADFDELPAERKLLLIERARKSVAFLGGLVENLTCGAAVRAGHLQVDASTLELSSCVHEAIALVQSLLSQRGQTAHVFGAEEAIFVTGDRARIIQVIANLLSNASRYSVANDAIEVHITASAHHVRVRVTDHGPGISPEDQQRVFSAWVRGESATPGGLGLGLSIVQNLIQQLGGRVGVESALGQGATFWFTLPNAA
jgi:signal transduction histidine kinase